MEVGDVLWRKVWSTYHSGRFISEKRVVISKLTPRFVYVQIPGATMPIEPKFHRKDDPPLFAHRKKTDYLSICRYTLEQHPEKQGDRND